MWSHWGGIRNAYISGKLSGVAIEEKIWHCLRWSGHAHRRLITTFYQRVGWTRVHHAWPAECSSAFLLSFTMKCNDCCHSQRKLAINLFVVIIIIFFSICNGSFSLWFLLIMANSYIQSNPIWLYSANFLLVIMGFPLITLFDFLLSPYFILCF